MADETTDGMTPIGIALKIGDGETTETFGKIPGIQDLDGLGQTREMIHAQKGIEGGRTKKYPGNISDDPITVTCNYDPDSANQAQLLTDQNAGTLRNFQLVFTDDTPATAAFAAYVSGWKIGGINASGVPQLSFTLEPDGGFTIS